jgi:hypothetical protein
LQTTTRLGLKKIELTDTPPDITVLNANWDVIEAKMMEADSSIASMSAGLFAARPVAGTAKRYYFATDKGELWRDTGTTWVLAAASADAVATHLAETATQAHLAKNIAIEDAGSVFTATQVEGALSELFTSASNGKNSIAAAITGMGQAASGSETFANLAAKIADISDDATAGVGDVLPTKTFYQGGTKKTGNMATKDIATITPGTANQTIAANQYLTGIQTILGDADLVAANIKSSANIFGVVGTFTGVKSIQYVTIALGVNDTSKTASISSVDTTKSIICFLGNYITTSSNAGFNYTSTRVELTDATTVTAYRYASSAVANTVSAVVIEFETAVINSKQSGTITLPLGTATATATITSVNAVKSLLIFCGSTTNTVSGLQHHFTNITLTNGTTITANRYATSSDVVLGWNLIEFK